MFDHHALGQSSRARRVDDVGKVRGLRASRWIAFIRRFKACVCIDHKYGGVRLRQLRLQIALRDDYRRFAVGEVMRQAVLGVFRIKRQIRPARFENAQRTRKQIWPARTVQPDHGVRLNAHVPQHMCHAICVLIEFGKGNLAGFMHQSDGFRRFGDLCFECRLHGFWAIQHHLGLVLPVQNGLELGRWERAGFFSLRKMRGVPRHACNQDIGVVRRDPAEVDMRLNLAAIVLESKRCAFDVTSRV